MIAETSPTAPGRTSPAWTTSPKRSGRRRRAPPRKRIGWRFQVGDINALDLPDGFYDAIISIDTLYFSDDYTLTIRQFVQALKPGGQMLIFFAHGREPWVPKDEFPAASILPDRTPLAEALKANGLTFQATDFTPDELPARAAP